MNVKNGAWKYFEEYYNTSKYASPSHKNEIFAVTKTF